MVRFLLSAKSYAEIYGNAVEAAGAKATFCSEGTDETLFDALLLCGGSAVSTRRYGEARHGAKEPDEERDEAELRLLRSFTEAGKPVFGICRGEQLINVFFGGTLIQHLPTWDYHVNFQLHEVTALPDSPIGRIYGERFTVNSAHHQAINRLGKGLRDIAWSENGKIIEAVVHET
ncbi:MAG: gamma-glutamyl-gamma-aminobutyrate hydrolase family protein, partial [Clostridia bacterium]|nr:gamma-glutamyl-gamma-aminobutyrate hydrolase family protein [Clostridia bacterium]